MATQGNALGIGIEVFAASPERAQFTVPDGELRPFRAYRFLWWRLSQGVALGCHSAPLRG